MTGRRFLLRVAASAAPLLAAGARPATVAWAPDRPLRLVVPFPPGGPTDIVARLLAQKLSEPPGQPVVVENRGGAGGNIGAEHVARSPSDGHTLLLATVGVMAINPALYGRLSYDAATDLAPVALVAAAPVALVAHPSLPARTVAELVALAKARGPRQIAFGSAGNGSAQHLALEMFMLQAGVKAIHVPYKGSGPMLTDLIGGQINYSFDTMTAATPHVKNGKAIAIAQTHQKRATGHPNVPTMNESGFPGFEATTWYGLVGPGKMSAAMAKRMNEDVNKVLQMPDVMERLEASGAEDGGGSTEKFSQFIKVEQQKWAKVIKDAGVKAEI